MKPEIWGPNAWRFIHTITVAYPENPTQKDKINYRNFFTNMQYVLPCEKCKSNMSNHLDLIPLDDEALNSRLNLTKWGIDLHNAVNKQNGKRTLSYKEGLNEIDKMLNGESIGYGYTLKIIMLIVIILILILICKKN